MLDGSENRRSAVEASTSDSSIAGVKFGIHTTVPGRYELMFAFDISTTKDVVGGFYNFLVEI
jgi:hypothetical protein